MSSLDLDINSYDYDDLLNLFGLENNFDDKNIDTINQIVQTVKREKVELYEFYFKASKIILTIYALYNNDEIINNDIDEINKLIVKIKAIANYERYDTSALILEMDLSRYKERNSFIQPRIQPPFIKEQIKTNTIENIFQNSIVPGNLNAIKRLTNVVNLNLNTCFRNNYYNSNPCDFQYTLPVEIKNVVALRFASIEMPNAWYLFSSKKRNNVFYVEVTNITNGTNTKYEVVIPDGNYDNSTLENFLNSTYFYLSTNPSELNNLKLTISTSTLKSKIEVYGVPNPQICFTITFFNDDTCQNMMSTVGWSMGFRLAKYKNINKSILSEGIFDAAGDRYIFVSLDDYQYNNNILNIVCFDKSSIEKNIIAKIPMINGKFSMVIDDNSSPLTKTRKYNGPVNIRNLNIKLLDRFGEVIDINNMDYSFTLELEILYEGFNFREINA